jgi:uncharacterized protein YdeI (YjbR/CyaY-like superfamily)
MNPKVDPFFTLGCGRCPLGGTPQCKVHQWQEELQTMRNLLLSSGLEEELKWGVPCYTLNGKNVAIISALKEYCAIGFFKGVLLTDPKNMLSSPGENSQSSRLIKITKLQQIIDPKPEIEAFVRQAITIEQSGKKVDFAAKHTLSYPEELIQIFAEDPNFESAFEALTPGRKRGYVLFFNGAKQTATRTSRIQKCMSKIIAGKGLQE